jgi:hypothetical protein
MTIQKNELAYPAVGYSAPAWRMEGRYLQPVNEWRDERFRMLDEICGRPDLEQWASGDKVIPSYRGPRLAIRNLRFVVPGQKDGPDSHGDLVVNGLA